AKLENVVFKKRPQCVPKRAHHCHALVREFRNTKRRIPVCFAQHFFEVAERKLPDCILQFAERFAAKDLIAFMYRLKRVPHAAFAEELGLTEVGVPPGTTDPASHHEAAARYKVNVQWRCAREKLQDLITHLRGTALVGIQTENPIAATSVDGAVTQITKALE